MPASGCVRRSVRSSSRGATRGRTLLSPVFAYWSEPDRSRTIVLGLWWDLQGPGGRARVGAPLWWDVQWTEDEHRVATFFPFYWRYERPEETTNLAVNGMWSSGHSEAGPSSSLHVFAFFDVASYNPGHALGQVFGGLVGHERQRTSGRWRFLWLWGDPPSEE